MNPAELYKLWAPRESIWSNWAKPVLFADNLFASSEPPQTAQWESYNTVWAPAVDSGAAILLDLPGADAIWYGMALSRHGYRPVPLYNGVRGPSLGGFELVQVEAIVIGLHAVGEAIGKLQLPANAPPVFLLDENRFNGEAFATSGRFDNRWWVFPQDFPSANFLLSKGIKSVLLGQNRATGPQRDLAHVLLRWQEAGIQIFCCAVGEVAQPQPLQVERPGNFRALWYQALVLAGLRRNSTGGFGATIPEPGSSGGFG